VTVRRHRIDRLLVSVPVFYGGFQFDMAEDGESAMKTGTFC
jgi:hypothetical protein